LPIGPTTPADGEVTDPTPQASGPVPPATADTPAGLAAQIEQAERTVRDPSTSPEDLAAAGHTQQVAYRRLGAMPEWDTEVLALVAPDLRPIVEANASARREFMGMVNRIAENVPAWQIVAPEPPEALRSYYDEAEALSGVGWEYLAAINLVETGMGRIRGLSTADAKGPMQFIDPTWERWGEGDVWDPHDAILAAGRYLEDRGFAEDPAAAVFAYNNHNNYVRAVLAYAGIMEADPQAFYGFYNWEIHYLSMVGDLWLPEGYELVEARPAADWLAEHPELLSAPVPPMLEAQAATQLAEAAQDTESTDNTGD
jgi:membrane-bound lytic murein transglycosylase B